jgi:predicted TIM-barrel enzyme
MFRANLEETGMGYGLEVECVAAAHGLGLLTTPYVFDERQAVDMTAAGADILVAHMGLTVGGSIGAESALTLDDCVARVNAIAAAGRSVRDDVLVLCHGGPIAMPEDADFILRRCDIEGFYGASSMERLPTETAIKAQVQDFTKLMLPQGRSR